MTTLYWYKLKEQKNTRVNIFGKVKNQKKISQTKYLEQYEISWYNYILRKTNLKKILNKKLLEKTFEKEYIDFLHVTPNLNQIKKAKEIQGSGGGLGSAIYCSILNTNNQVHNITDLYYSFQLAKKYLKLDIILIRIFLNKRDYKQIKNWGVDYTLFGKESVESWNVIKKKISKKEKERVENKIINQIKIIKPYLNNYLDSNKVSKINTKDVIRYYKKIFGEIPEIRFILYEILAEYILYFQNNKNAQKLARKGEIYNLNQKKFINDLCPTMLKKFNMMNFYIEPEKIIKYLNRKKIIVDFKEKHFIFYLKWRLHYYLKKILRNEIKTINFKSLETKNPYLIGHILYKTFKSKEIFEKYRSKILREKWKKEKLICPIYFNIPKGELGINSDIENLGIKYETYSTIYNKKNKKIKINKKLNLKIVSKHVNYKKTSVR